MKKLMMIFVSIFMVSSVLLAQERQHPSAESVAKKQTERMAEKLSLTNEQKAQIETINLKYAQKSQEARQAEKEAQKAGFQQFKEEKNAELKAVLTDEQYTKYQQENPRKDKMRKSKGKKHKNKN